MKETCAQGAVTNAQSIVNTSMKVFAQVCDYNIAEREGETNREDVAAAKRDWARLLQSAICSLIQYAHPGKQLILSDTYFLEGLVVSQKNSVNSDPTQSYSR